MADSFSKITDSRKLFKKAHGDGEDPIIVAQRFLNIFRQLHIFNNERKDAFNKMILSQPPEIRGMFGTLPGGSLLQEYVDDLEQISGIIPEHTPSPAVSSELSDEISKAKILATALAEAQLQASAKFQQSTPQFQAPLQSPQQFQNVTMSGEPLKVTADASFAKEIAAAFTQALKYTEENRKNESREIAAAIISSQEKMAQVIAKSTSEFRNLAPTVIESQEIQRNSNGTDNKDILDAIVNSQNKMAQMFMQHNNVATNSSSNNNANNIQINTAPLPPVEDMVRGIVKAQSELFREMSEVQTKELTAIISVALKESQQLSTQTVVETLTGLQKETQKFWEAYALNIPKYAPQSVTTPPEDLPQPSRSTYTEAPINIPRNSFAEVAIPQRPSFAPNDEIPDDEMDDDEADESLTSKLSESVDDTTENEEILPKKKKKKKKKKNKNRENSETQSDNIADIPLINNSSLDISLFDDGNVAPVTHKVNIKSSLSHLAASIFGKNTPDDEDDFSDLSIDLEKSLSEEDGDLTWSKLPDDEENIPPLSSGAESTEEEEGEWTWEEVPAEEEAITQTESEPVKGIVEPAEEEEGEWTWEEVPAEAEAIAQTESEPVKGIVEPAEEEEGEWTWEEAPAEVEAIAQTESESMEGTVEPAEEEEGEWTWEEVPTEIAEIKEEEHIETIENPETLDTKLESSNVTIENPIDLDVQNLTDFNFEKFDFEDSSENKIDFDLILPKSTAEPLPEAQLEPMTPDEAEEDWEWEYEEEAPENTIPVNNVPNIAEIIPEKLGESISPDNQESEEEDWEWEYEEALVDEDLLSTASEKKMATDEDWEWEYEEDTEETPLSTELLAEQNVLENASAATMEKPKDEFDLELEDISDELETDTISNPLQTSLDPYGILENIGGNDDDNILNPLLKEDFIFPDDFHRTSPYTEAKPVIHMNDIDLGIAEISDENDKKEPYIPKDDII